MKRPPCMISCILTVASIRLSHSFVNNHRILHQGRSGIVVNHDSPSWRLHETSPFRKLSDVNEDNNFDLVVIGAGPAGVRAAISASSAPHNKKVCLVDAPRLSGVLMDERNNKDLSIGGPTGLFSKALRDVSKKINVSTLRGMGLREESVWNEVMVSCLDLASANALDVHRQLSLADVEYKEAFASFTGARMGDNPQLMIQGSPGEDGTFPPPSFLHPKNVLIATGSRPSRPKEIPFDNKRLFDSDSINTLSYLPKSVVITGSGIVAIEYAKIFANLGSSVKVIIRGVNPRKALMKIGLDKEIAATLVADMLRSGIKFERGAVVKKYVVPPMTSSGVRPPIKLVLGPATGEELPCGEKEKDIVCDVYMAAIGRLPNSSKMGLEEMGVEVDAFGNVMVGADLKTTADGIYAAGDILGRPFLASTGVAQAVAAIGFMFGDRKPKDFTCEVLLGDDPGENELTCVDGNLSSAGASFDPVSLASNPFAFPAGIWSSPEAAWYGLNTEQAKELGIDAGEGIALYAECLRGQVFSPNGLLKLVIEKPTRRILGIHICGDDACELIHYGMELVRSKRTVDDVIGNLYSAVTYHEMYRIAAMAAIDQAGARKRRAGAGAALAQRQRNKSNTAL